jgi:ABC-type branched-subunit amino acid transport system substrate-binding protein
MRRRAARRGRAVFLATLVLVAACSHGTSIEFETRARLTPKPAASTVATTVPTEVGGLLGGGGTGSAQGSTGGEGGNAAAAGAPIKLGIVLPLQGGQRAFGEPVLRATQAYIDELNSVGGVNGSRLQLISYNACLLCQDESLQAVRRLVEQDGVFAIVNTYVMVVAFQSVIPYLVQHGVPLVQGGAENQTSDALSPINFATAPPGLFYANLLPAMATDYVHAAKIGITYLDVPSEANGIPILRRQFEARGVEVVDVEPIGAAEDAVTNMDGAVTKMRAAGAQAVLATNPVLVIYGRLAADRQGWDVSWFGPAAWSRLVEDSCGVTCDDLVLTDTAGLSWVERDTPQMHQYVDTMRRRFPGGELTGHTLAAWVGMQLTVEALRRSGPDQAAFLRTMESFQNLDLGTTSPLTFNPDRHLGGTLTTLLRLKGGHYYAATEPVTYGEADG